MLKSLLMVCFLSSCQAPTPPVYPVTPAVAANSTYQVEVSENGSVTGFGTAWIAQNKLPPFGNEPVSYLVTAGHVCHSTTGMPTFRLIARDNTSHMAFMVKYAFTPQIPGSADICILRAPSKLGPPLLLSHGGLYYGDTVTYVGAPATVWGDGVAPIIRGNYAGGKVVTAPTFPGASGAAVFIDNGVIGMITSYNQRFHHLTNLEPMLSIEEYLK